MPIDPVTSVGAGSSIGNLGSQAPGAESTGTTGGFGDMLVDKIQSLEAMQKDANQKALALATGQSQDVASVVMAVERASLSIQLASQIRNRGVEAYQEIWRLQV